MPDCGCFHNFNLTPMGGNAYQISLALEGKADVKLLFEDAGLATSVEISRSLSLKLPKITATVRLSGVTDANQVAVFCAYLKSAMIIDLTPSIDHCYALEPYSLFPDGSHSHSKIGSLINRAKYHKDNEAGEDLSSRLLDFIDSHPILSQSEAIAVPPKSVPNSLDLPSNWAKSISNEMGWKLVSAAKIRQTEPQKEFGESDTEEEMIVRVQDSVTITSALQDPTILMLDDTIGSGGTLVELARALRQAGATRVYGLSAAKDARFTHGGINLDRSAWI